MDQDHRTPAVRHTSAPDPVDRCMHRRGLAQLLGMLDTHRLSRVEEDIPQARVERSTASASMAAHRALRPYLTTDDAVDLAIRASDLGTARLMIAGELRLRVGLILGAALQFASDVRAVKAGTLLIDPDGDAEEPIDYSAAVAQAVRSVDDEWESQCALEVDTVRAQVAKVEGADPISVAVAAVEAAIDYREAGPQEAAARLAEVAQRIAELAESFAGDVS